MKLRTPVTGALVDVADDRAARYLAKGFQKVEEPKRAAKADEADKAEAPKKKAAPKKAAKKAEPEEE